jgi:hypothetical protein
VRAGIIGVPREETPDVKAIVLAEPVEVAAAKARQIQEKGPSRPVPPVAIAGSTTPKARKGLCSLKVISSFC